MRRLDVLEKYLKKQRRSYPKSVDHPSKLVVGRIYEATNIKFGSKYQFVLKKIDKNIIIIQRYSEAGRLSNLDYIYLSDHSVIPYDDGNWNNINYIIEIGD